MIGGERGWSSASRPSSRRSSRASTPHRAPRAHGRADRGRARVPALRAERRRPLREDGAQRNRVRAHGRLLRGAQRPRERKRGPRANAPPMQRRRRSSIPSTTRYEIDTAEVAELWRRGSVVGVVAARPHRAALHESPTLEELAGRVSDSGEGRWTSIAAIERASRRPVLTTALYSRFASRDADDFANRVLSAMRRQFGGHGRSRNPRRRGPPRRERRRRARR